MRTPALLLLATTFLLAPTIASAQVAPKFQDFEGLTQNNPNSLSTDGWLIFGEVYSADRTTLEYNYGPFPAPNHQWGFSQITTGEGGVDQGAQQLNMYSDYNNVDHGNGKFIESIFYREWQITSANVGEVWEFFFEAKKGNLEGLTTAQAFIKTIDPATSYSTTNLVSEDMTNTPTTWTGYAISLEIIPELVGQLFQIGFSNNATAYQGSAVFYDNIDFRLMDLTPAPSLLGIELSQNVPNPFNPTTVIRFAVDQAGPVELVVYDAAGRRVATLGQPRYDAGQHQVWWDGRSDSGAAVASGRYSYVLRTPQGELSRSMLLLK